MRKYLPYYMSVNSHVSETCVLHVQRIKDFSKEHKNNSIDYKRIVYITPNFRLPILDHETLKAFYGVNFTESCQSLGHQTHKSWV